MEGTRNLGGRVEKGEGEEGERVELTMVLPVPDGPVNSRTRPLP